MFDRVGERVAVFDLTGAGSVPVWAIAVIVAFFVAVYVLASIRGVLDGRIGRVALIAVALLLALTAWWGLDHLAHRDLAGERLALEGQAFELTTRALAPGSALVCLDAVAGDMMEDACEKALFASPEATAAAVAYVAAELSILASASEHARRGEVRYGSAVMNLRRSVEADRFGIVAHVLAVRDGCTPDQCAALTFLQGTGRVRENLAERPFDTYLKSHLANWPAAGSGQAAHNPSAGPVPSVPNAAGPYAAGQASALPSVPNPYAPGPYAPGPYAAGQAPALPSVPNPYAPGPYAPGPYAAGQAPVLSAAKQPNNLYYPSSASIPAVSIMTAEPQQPQSPPRPRSQR
jgi:hypothetical protein